ncbi:pyrroline-5-carboxylate reductase [Austwickia chelonae]|uniref:Pyrroline-5-carboxylate reductase n=1 Tax=Austwickia chelonae NBRC 105200 TaxID=1184607 RepID=K6VJJ2_9MICO|nr:pyrroline-5-carboxylate reductase [Austwickia chelonae]GAB76909.1 pyrroline-5-carboxylate reductase [Austwickia chelonae NBRC 105200]SEW32240.1 pyrroline-5-carboxylate reductase [Austwickia chelonae]
MTRLAVLGAGVMGTAILSALLDAGAFQPEQVSASTLDDDCRRRLTDELKVSVTDNARAVSDAEVVLISVKPDVVSSVLSEIRDQLPEGALVISVAAGVTLDTLESELPEGTAVIRVMPNTPVVVREGMLVLSPGKECSAGQIDRAQELLSWCGSVLTVPEKYQDMVTGVSGSGPAYVFALVEAMIEGAVVQGLPRAVATELTVQTLYGAASLLRQQGGHPALLREQVTSPGGTTAAGLRALDAGGFRVAVVDAVEAATRRAGELGS